MRKLIAGNWKMNGSLAANEALVRALLAGLGQPACDVAVCPPAAYLAQVQQLHMAQTVQRTAWVALARHMAVLGHADLPVLAQDLQTLGQTQPDPGWQSGLQGLADALRLADSLQAARQTAPPPVHR